MDYRSVLEVFKFLPIDMLRQVSLTCSQWNQISCSPELLQQLREDFNSPADLSLAGRLNVVTQLVLGITFANLSNSLRFYRCDLDRWTARTEVAVELQGLVGYSAVFLPDASLLVTGGEFNDKTPGNSARKQFRRVYRVTRDGTFTRLKNMIERRRSHALVLIDAVVYAFGGRGLKGILTCCEKLALEGKLQGRNWAAISDMQIARHSFNPCGYNHSVYICGGDTQGKCEIFDTQSLSFTLFALRLSPHTRSACCFVDNSYLLVLTSEWLYRWKLDGTESYSQLEHEKHLIYGQMNPIMYRNCIYILVVLTNPKVWIYSLAGNTTRETSVPPNN